MGIAQDSPETEGASFFENEWTDQFKVNFGEWADQSVDWIDTRLEWMLDVIKFPFDSLLSLVVDNFLEQTPWWIVVLIMFMIGWLARSFRVGLFALVSLSFCAILGPGYWIETARTIGFIAVAVLLCVIIGIPVGIACGRIDPVWSVVRPVLDAMQVVHSFVYMLPFIFFFGIGEESATMVTMVFALPPLIRLTNLGIRQVPEDVVEASRAYGAPEFRVLMDVQIPLARPAIMTGVNQTLLLAISMLGIAAIMGAGGLGRLMFQALSGQDVARGASAGLAFFLVAVSLDRISQPDEGSSQSLFTRMRGAWAHRQNPENLLDAEAEAAKEAEERNFAGRPAPVAASEGMGIRLAMGGAALGVISVVLPWASDAGFATSHSRRGDDSLAGETFNGISANGGSFWGLFVLVAAGFVLTAGFLRLTRPDSGRFMSADGITIAGLAALGTSLGYVFGSAAASATDFSKGFGVYVALVASLLMVAGGVMALRDAPYAPHRPVASKPEYHRVVGGLIALLLAIGGTFAGWSFDERNDSVVSAEDEARIEELRAIAEADPTQVNTINIEIQAIYNSARQSEKIINDSWIDTGATMGLPSLIAAFAAFGAVLAAAGVIGSSEQHRKWRWSAVSVGLGVATAAVGAAWIASVTRATDPSYIVGVGAFMVFIAGVFFVSSGRALLKEFFRTEVFDDDPVIDVTQSSSPVEESVPEPV
ncbi:MAG: ABC transporter permease subunit [Actinomycetota bacterium]